MKIPFDFESEASLLSRMLNSVNAVNDAIGSLQSEDFYDPVHRVIFSSMRALYAQDCKIEAVSVASVMSKDYPDKADTAYLFGLGVQRIGDVDETRLFIKNIKEAARLKNFMFIGTELTAAANSGKTSEEIHSEVTKKIEIVFSEDYEKSSLTLDELVKKDYSDSGKDFLAFIEDQMENHRKGIKVLRGLPTGFPKIDDYLSGFCKGHFIVLGARPGAGKTTLALNFIHNLIKKGISVGFFSLEMTAEEAMKKLGCIEGYLDQEKVERGEINAYEYQTLVVAINSIAKMPLIIDDQESLRVSHLVSRTKRMVAANKIKVLFIDYLGEVKGDGKFANKQEEIQSVSKALRGLAKKLKIPIICIAQLNRQSEIQNRAPNKSDLRESGQIEADAHSILLLDKPSTDDPLISPGLVKVYIVKNRFGQQGCVHLGFDGAKGKFLEIDYTKRDDE